MAECMHCGYTRTPPGKLRCYNCGRLFPTALDGDASECDPAGGSMLLVARDPVFKRRVEFDGETIRLVGEPGLAFSGVVVDIPAASLLDVELKKPGRLMGQLRFIWPGAKQTRSLTKGIFSMDTPGSVTQRLLSEGAVQFRPSEEAEFMAVYEAAMAPILEARRVGADMLGYLTPNAMVPETTPALAGLTHYEGLRLGEVSSQFDSQMAGQIAGSLRHELGFHGGFVGLGIGGLGLGVGRLGLSGVSTVDLATESTSRPDLLNQGFVAVFEIPASGGLADTLRVVVPSEAASAQMVKDFAYDVAQRMGRHAPSEPQLDRVGEVLDSIISTEITYALDRANAALRLPVESRPLFDVVGMPIGPSAVLGGALRIQGSTKWIQLFPLGLMHAMLHPDEAPRLVLEAAIGRLSAPAQESAPQSAVSGVSRGGQPEPDGSGKAAPLGAAAMKTCPMCAEDVRAAAKICRYCHYEFGPPPSGGSGT